MRVNLLRLGFVRFIRLRLQLTDRRSTMITIARATGMARSLAIKYSALSHHSRLSSAVGIATRRRPSLEIAS